VTVCIAARSGQNIIGVCDRMLTSGDIQFEPTGTNKLHVLTSSIGILQAGDAAFNTEIMREVISIVESRVRSNPAEWWLLKDVADLYVKYRNVAKRKRAEAELLAPLGLTIDTYRDELRKFGDSTGETLVRDLIQYQVPYTAVLIAGLDPLGAHIYVVDDGNISCNDAVAFAAIGIGARHAESQFMFAKHAWNSPIVDTGLLAYVAKKRAEIAPGVGEATDMFTVGPLLGSLAISKPESIDAFERIYQTLRANEESNRDEASRQANDIVAKAAAEAASRPNEQQESTVEGADSPEGKPKSRAQPVD
jgi:hypothetical protein